MSRKTLKNISLNLTALELYDILKEHNIDNNEADLITDLNALRLSIVNHCIEQSDKNDCLKGR